MWKNSGMYNNILKKCHRYCVVISVTIQVLLLQNIFLFLIHIHLLSSCVYDIFSHHFVTFNCKYRNDLQSEYASKIK